MVVTQHIMFVIQFAIRLRMARSDMFFFSAQREMLQQRLTYVKLKWYRYSSTRMWSSVSLLYNACALVNLDLSLFLSNA